MTHPNQRNGFPCRCEDCEDERRRTRQKVPKELDAIADTVLAYRPKARSRPAVQRKRRRTIFQKKRAEGGHDG